jgi:cytosine/adenosine deaminase-related metal-dependent hydrolase
MDSERRVIRDGSIAIEGSTILDIDKTEEMTKRYSPEKIINVKNKIILPGLIDSHVHLTNEGPKGFVPDNIPAAPWLTDWIRPITGILNPEDEYFLALSTIIEMIKTGTTTFCEASTVKFIESVTEAVEQTGIRGIIGRRTLDIATSRDSGVESTEQALENNKEVIEKFHGPAEGRIQV